MALNIRTPALVLAVAFLAVSPPRDLAAQEPLEDNSFLVEEAYNQPDRVVQHIFASEMHHGDAAVSFTQEWPLGGPKHQLSYTLVAAHDTDLTFGDALLNYRWQAIGLDGGDLHFSPRLSALVPLGDADRLGGNGGWGVQAALPLSWKASKHLTLNGNLGAGWRPNAEGPTGATASTLDGYAGASAIVFLSPMFNLIAESVWRRGTVVTGPGESEGGTSHAIALGARAGFDVGNVQLVPGLAWMPAIDDIATRSFLYLSVEHSF